MTRRCDADALVPGEQGPKYPIAFLAGDERTGLRRWAGTLLTDRHQAYDSVLDPGLHPDRQAAACVAHARRKFDELAKARTSVLADEAVVRLAHIYAIEAGLTHLPDEERRRQRQALAAPLWAQLRAWLELERRRVVDGGATAAAIDYTLGHWKALTRYLDDGAVPIDNHLERQIKPWAMGANNWLFAGSLRAGKRAAAVMSRVHSARRPRPVHLHARHARAPACAAGQPYRRAAAALLDAGPIDGDIEN